MYQPQVVTSLFVKLQHTAPHCNTLQHTRIPAPASFWLFYVSCTAPCCNTLQHSATHCNTLQHTATRTHTRTSLELALFCSELILDFLEPRLNCVLQCVAAYCSVLQHIAARCSTSQCVAVYCSVLQRVAVCCSVSESFNGPTFQVSRPTHNFSKGTSLYKITIHTTR